MKGKLLIWLGCLLAVFSSLLEGAPSSLDYLFTPKLERIEFSPDGTHLASLMEKGNGPNVVVFRELSDDKADLISITDPSAGDALKNAMDYRWVNGQSMVVLSNWKDGNEAVHLIESGSKKAKRLHDSSRYKLVATLPEESAYLLAETPSGGGYGNCRVVRYDLANSDPGKVIFETESRGFEAYCDRAGELRLVKRNVGERSPLSWHAKPPRSDSWVTLSLKPNIKFYGFDYDPNVIWIGGNLKPGAPGIYRYSLSEGRVIDEVSKSPDYAVSEVGTPLFFDGLKSVVGLRLDLLEKKSQWSHELFEKVQARIDQIFKDTNNCLEAWSPDLSMVVVERHFEDIAPQTTLINLRNPKVELLFIGGHNVGKDVAARRELISLTAKNGATLSGIFTRKEESKKSSPLVVLLRPEPWWNMDTAAWNAEEQFLAAEGYAVLRINFRGTGTLGGKNWLGWKSEKDVKAPVEDIDTAISWLVKNRNIDAKRIAIVSSGSSGWLAMYAGVVLPNRFKAIVSNSGLYDLVEYRKGGKVRQMAEVPFAKDKRFSEEELQRFSPAHNLDQIKAALFIAYAEGNPDDYTSQAWAFYKSAKKAGITIEKPYVGPWWGTRISKDSDLKDYYKKVGNFLEKHLK